MFRGFTISEIELVSILLSAHQRLCIGPLIACCLHPFIYGPCLLTPISFIKKPATPVPNCCSIEVPISNSISAFIGWAFHLE